MRCEWIDELKSRKKDKRKYQKDLVEGYERIQMRTVLSINASETERVAHAIYDSVSMQNSTTIIQNVKKSRWFNSAALIGRNDKIEKSKRKAKLLTDLTISIEIHSRPTGSWFTNRVDLQNTSDTE